MDNKRMAKRSEVFQDDKGVVIEKRCFFLMCGEDDLDSNYLTIQSSINIFKEPREAFKVVVDVKVHNTIIEMCNDVI